MSVVELLRQASALPALEARLLLARVLQRNRAWLSAHPEAPVTSAQAQAFAALCSRREQGEPIAYLLGEREFYGLRLRVNPSALIPRPETEILVELALARLPQDAPGTVLDLGTGTGAIALALADARPLATCTATDISPEALALARANASELGLHNVDFVVSDWYAALAPQAWDLIVANPPYIAGSDRHLERGDLRYEPRVALTPEGDGLAALRRIVAGAAARLKPGGWLIVEHGWDQGTAVRSLFVDAGFAAPQTERDLAGIERVTLARPGAGSLSAAKRVAEP